MVLLKEGPVDFWDNGVFKDQWEPRYIRYYSDGKFELYSDNKDKTANRRVDVPPVYEYFFHGQETANVPGQPNWADNVNLDLVVCFPEDTNRDADKIIWLMFNRLEVKEEWVAAFKSTFPGGEHSAQNEQREQENLDRERVEHEREYNRPSSSRHDRPLGGARGLPQSNYINGNLGQFNPNAFNGTAIPASNHQNDNETSSFGGQINLTINAPGINPGMMMGMMGQNMIPGMMMGMMGQNMMPGMNPHMQLDQPNMHPFMQPGHPGMQPHMQPGHPGMQPHMQPGHPGMQPHMQPGHPGMHPHMQPGHPGMHPDHLDMHPHMQPGHPGMHPDHPDMHPHMQPDNPGMQFPDMGMMGGGFPPQLMFPGMTFQTCEEIPAPEIISEPAVMEMALILTEEALKEASAESKANQE